jgi:protein-S-isoprenylcysteine O-methyltransferase Ste14
VWSCELAIYVVHGCFWGTFAITRLVLRSRDGKAGAAPTAAVAAQGEQTAPFSRVLVAFHMLAFGLMYFGLANAVLPNRVPEWFIGQRVVGAAVIAVGAALAAWALAYFRSWRFRAKLDEGHQLATGGPFALLRHPIYMALNLLALGTALWAPTVITWSAVALMALGSDLRARAEERLLEQSFGAVYRDYRARTRRFIPGLY